VTVAGEAVGAKRTGEPSRQLKTLLVTTDDSCMQRDNATERRSGADRRRGAERRNGLAVLLAGCPDCDRIAPSPAEMHSEGWLVVADDAGLTLVACPEHRPRFEQQGLTSGLMPGPTSHPGELEKRHARAPNEGRLSSGFLGHVTEGDGRMNVRSSDRSQKQISYEPILVVIAVGLVLVAVIIALALILLPGISHVVNTPGN
jgi:hypothetical protein